MGRFAKSVRRKAYLKKKAEVEAKLGSAISMFDRLPESCQVCGKAFGKTNKEHVKTWTVNVRGKEKAVYLFCPDCVSAMKETVDDYLDNVENAKVEEETPVEETAVVDAPDEA